MEKKKERTVDIHQCDHDKGKRTIDGVFKISAPVRPPLRTEQSTTGFF